MDKKKLNQYRSLKKEIPTLQKKLDKLYERKMNVPEVKGKVKASSKDFPYIESHVSVDMYEPGEYDNIKKQIKVNENRLKQAAKDKLEIEIFIAEIKDSTDRMIFEKVFLEGMKLKEVGEMLGYSKGRISQKISEILED